MASVERPTIKSYGFIGLGVMGSGMAKNLRTKIPPNSPLYVCEVVTDRRDQWVANTAGDIRVASNPIEISQKCDIIITMLPRGEHVEYVFTNPTNGLLSNSPSSKNGEKIFIDCSTINVKTSQVVAKAVEASSLGIFADAPVSGGVHGANAGTLSFMVGGTQDTFDKVKPIISHMGKPESIFYCGSVGAGLATKLINNYLSAVNMIGVCEGMNMGRLYGLNPETLAGVVNVSTGMSRNSREQNPVKGISPVASSANDFEGGFTTELCQGVLEMAIELGESLGAKTVLTSSVQRLFRTAVESDECKGKDFRSIWRLFSEIDNSS